MAFPRPFFFSVHIRRPNPSLQKVPSQWEECIENYLLPSGRYIHMTPPCHMHVNNTLHITDSILIKEKTLSTEPLSVHPVQQGVKCCLFLELSIPKRSNLILSCPCRWCYFNGFGVRLPTIAWIRSSEGVWFGFLIWLIGCYGGRDDRMMIPMWLQRCPWRTPRSLQPFAHPCAMDTHRRASFSKGCSMPHGTFFSYGLFYIFILLVLLHSITGTY